ISLRSGVQTDSKQRATGQIKRPSAFMLCLLLQVFVALTGGVKPFEVNHGPRLNPLHRPAFRIDKNGAQALVALHQSLESLPEAIDIQRGSDPDGPGNVIS